MQTEVFGDDGDPDLVVVLGWGNRIDHENVRWLVDLLVDGGYRVHVFQIPVNISDFQAEYLDPVLAYIDRAGLGEYRFLGHSTGGLVGAHVRDPTPVTRTYLSPWWGYPEDQQGIGLRIVEKLPLSAQVVPAGTADRDALGELATDRQIAENPGTASPAFIGATRRAQADLPPFDGDAVVFYTPEDRVVSVPAIEDRVPERNRIAYQGGHELFSSPAREEPLDVLLAAVDRGLAGIDDE